MQRLYQKECQSRRSGEYSSRYTLGTPGPGQVKQILRPLSVARMQVHGMLDATEEWKNLHGENWEKDLATLPFSVGYLKHIQPGFWFEDGVEKHVLCSFGEGALSDGLDSGFSVFF